MNEVSRVEPFIMKCHGAALTYSTDGIVPRCDIIHTKCWRKLRNSHPTMPANTTAMINALLIIRLASALLSSIALLRIEADSTSRDLTTDLLLQARDKLPFEV